MKRTIGRLLAIVLMVLAPIGWQLRGASAVSDNLIPNPSVENTSNGTTPDSWVGSNTGTSTVKFRYLSGSTEAHTGTRAVSLQVTAYTNGTAGWTNAPQAVTPGNAYTYSDWSKSTVASSLVVKLSMTDGSQQVVTLANVPAKGNWTARTATYTMPSGVSQASFSHVVSGVGILTTDDYSLTSSTVTPTQFNRGIVTITYDDGYNNQYTYARPLMNQYGYKGTYFIITSDLPSHGGSLTPAQLSTLQTEGNEIGSHTVTHPDLTTLSPANLTNELQTSQSTLISYFGGTVRDFAAPYGKSNATTLAEVKKYYSSQRLTSSGYNGLSGFDPYGLHAMELNNNISAATVQGWIDQAVSTHSWLILLIHSIGATPNTGNLNSTTTDVLNSTLSYLQTKGVAVETTSQALQELTPQLGQ